MRQNDYYTLDGEPCDKTGRVVERVRPVERTKANGATASQAHPSKLFN